MLFSEVKVKVSNLESIHHSLYMYIYYSINNYTVSKERILNNSWVLPAQQASSSR